jgi:hypothetical protein
VRLAILLMTDILRTLQTFARPHSYAKGRGKKRRKKGGKEEGKRRERGGKKKGKGREKGGKKEGRRS